MMKIMIMMWNKWRNGEIMIKEMINDNIEKMKVMMIN